MSVNNEPLKNGLINFVHNSVHWNNTNDNDAQCLNDIKRHFNLKSDFDAIQMAVSKFMPTLHQMNSLYADLIEQQNLLEQKTAVLRKVERQLQQMIEEV